MPSYTTHLVLPRAGKAAAEQGTYTLLGMQISTHPCKSFWQFLPRLKTIYPVTQQVRAQVCTTQTHPSIHRVVNKNTHASAAHTRRQIDKHKCQDDERAAFPLWGSEVGSPAQPDRMHLQSITPLEKRQEDLWGLLASQSVSSRCRERPCLKNKMKGRGNGSAVTMQNLRTQVSQGGQNGPAVILSSLRKRRQTTHRASSLMRFALFRLWV